MQTALNVDFPAQREVDEEDFKVNNLKLNCELPAGVTKSPHPSLSEGTIERFEVRNHLRFGNYDHDKFNLISCTILL